MLDWKQISEQYPKAWERFTKWAKLFHKKQSRVSITRNGLCWKTAVGNDRGQISNRICYDFFDTEGVRIEIRVFGIEDGYDYEIYNLDGNTLESMDGYLLTRTEAEQQAFTKAFSILEERLANA